MGGSPAGARSGEVRAWGLLGALCCLAAAGCSSSHLSLRPFGKLPDGREVVLYTLTNDAGMAVSVMNYGAAVVKWEVPGASGVRADVLLGYDTLAGYLGPNPYFGAIIGRYANRIADGLLPLDGALHPLSRNAPPHLLHGGFSGFDKKWWRARAISLNPPGIRFNRLSPDGEEGFPGNLAVSVTYTLTADNALRIAYDAGTDKPTVFNPTCHLYFNLDGPSAPTIAGQWLAIHAERYLPVNPQWLPTGEIRPVAGTDMDFRRPVRLGDRVLETRSDPIYFDHTYVLDGGPGAWAAELASPSSGRRLRIYTDQPGLQFYPGNSLAGRYVGKGGVAYPRFAGVCLEPAHFPDSPHHPDFPSTRIDPGAPYHSVTTYAFDGGAKTGAPQTVPSPIP